MGRLIDADKLSADMYHEAFEKDSDMQKWDSGCWIRYKMFENVLKAQPIVEAPDINDGSIDAILRRQATNAIRKMQTYKLWAGDDMLLIDQAEAQTELMMLPPVQPERKTGHWILDRSGAYCCSKCMEPCAGYVMMKPRDKFCKMCGSRNEVTE